MPSLFGVEQRGGVGAEQLGDLALGERAPAARLGQPQRDHPLRGRRVAGGAGDRRRGAAPAFGSQASCARAAPWWQPSQAARTSAGEALPLTSWARWQSEQSGASRCCSRGARLAVHAAGVGREDLLVAAAAGRAGERRVALLRRDGVGAVAVACTRGRRPAPERSRVKWMLPSAWRIFSAWQRAQARVEATAWLCATRLPSAGARPAEKSAWQSTQAWSGWTEALIFSPSTRIE